MYVINIYELIFSAQKCGIYLKLLQKKDADATVNQLLSGGGTQYWNLYFVNDHAGMIKIGQISSKADSWLSCCLVDFDFDWFFDLKILLDLSLALYKFDRLTNDF